MGVLYSTLLRRIRTQYRKGLKVASTEVGKEISEAYRQSIADFYGSYSPNWYEQTGDLYNASEDVFEGGEDSYTVGIRVDASNMGGHQNVSNDWVFSRAFEQGIHGIDERTWSGWESGAFGNKYFALSASYGKKSNIPPTMSPTPHALTEQRFNEACEKIPSIISSYL